jgi:hypothetical protein
VKRRMMMMIIIIIIIITITTTNPSDDTLAHISIHDDSCIMEYDAVSLEKWFPTFLMIIYSC